ncbi:MAG: S41 family peptidase [Anaerolineae bacterium]
MNKQNQRGPIRKSLARMGILLVAVLMAGWIFTMPRPAAYGLWKTEGYGFILDVSPLKIDLYDVTAVSCFRSMRLPANNFLLDQLGDGLQISGENDQLRIDAALNPIYGTTISSLPANCTSESNADPELNYEIFWHTFNEHYPFFDLHGVDWDARYAEIRPQVTSTTSDEELWEMMLATFDGLDDGHTWLTDNQTKGYSPASGAEWDADYQVYRTYLRDGFIEVPKAKITYGWLTDEIGYLEIAQMESETRFFQDRLALIASVLEDASAEFSSASTLVIDIRSNPGGFDQYALAIAEHFTPEAALAFSKTTRTGSGYTAPFEVYLTQSQASRFEQGIYLLTSDATGSGAEIFTLAMGTLPQVTSVGQPTRGALSDVLAKELPNGWSFGLSNQIYYAADGNVYEGIGVPADIDFPFDRDSMIMGRDTLLEEVIRLAENR